MGWWTTEMAMWKAVSEVAAGYLFGVVVVVFGVSGCDMFIEYGGEEGLPCLNDYDRCDEGLVCNFNVCVRPLFRNDVCDDEVFQHVPVCKEGLWCVDGYCVPAGGEGDRCIPDDGYGSSERGDCNDGLTCVDMVCVPAGREGLPCYGDGVESSLYYPCDDDALECVDDICTAG